MAINIFVTEGTSDVKTYQDAINLAGVKLNEAGAIKDGFSEACIDREKDFPTGLTLSTDLGIAIPHGNSKLVNNSSISFVRLAAPVDFGRMEDASQKVKCQFLFNLALAEGNQHLTTLQRLMKLFQDADFVEQIGQLPLSELTAYLQAQVISE